MALQEKLDAQRHELESAVPKDLLEIMHRATQDLENSELMKRVKKEGDAAPEFSLKNSGGESVSLDQMLSNGFVVLGFYRGRW